uniref:Uncharacterized protein n=1 Tax=Macrostomum lignano TaxID=282301 RepID=A0A1I8F8W5_9PLAT
MSLRLNSCFYTAAGSLPGLYRDNQWRCLNVLTQLLQAIRPQFRLDFFNSNSSQRYSSKQKQTLQPVGPELPWQPSRTLAFC